MRRVLQVATLFALALLTGCRGDGATRTTRINNVEGVFFNTANEVTVMVRYADGSIRGEDLHSWSHSVEYMQDVPAGQPMFAEHIERQELGDWEDYRVVVHLHSQSEITPGAWDRGKFGRGQNTRVE